jgi:hypothetical protein
LPEDRQAFEEQKTLFTRLHTNALELSQWIGNELPEMPEELSDDEIDDIEVKKAETSKSNAGARLFQDDDTRVFYEKLGDLFNLNSFLNFFALVNVEQFSATRTSSPTEDEVDDEATEFAENQVENLVENVNLSDLEGSGDEDAGSEEDEEPETETQAPTVISVQDDRAIGVLFLIKFHNQFIF